jgi:Phage terminase-like protein, large subunit
VSPGSENDFRLVSKWYYELFEKYNIRVFNIGYDRYSAIYFVKELEEEYSFDTTKVKQDHGTLSEPYKMLERDLKKHLVVYNNNPIDKFCLENAAIDVNKDQQMMIVKVEGQNNKKIDGAVTMGICYRVYMDNRPVFLDLVNNN